MADVVRNQTVTTVAGQGATAPDKAGNLAGGSGVNTAVGSGSGDTRPPVETPKPPVHVAPKEIIVAVVDNGVNFKSLSDYEKSKLYLNKGEVSGNGKDDDKNGKIDDIRGPNTGTEDNGYLLNPFATRNATHGLHMTQQIIGNIKTVEKLSGAEVKTSVMAVSSAGWYGNTIKAIEAGAKVVSLSLGFTPSYIAYFENLAKVAAKHDALIVIRNISDYDLGEIGGKDHIIELGFLSTKKPYGSASSVDFLEQGRTADDASESTAISKLAGKIAAVWGINPAWSSQEVLEILSKSTDLNHPVAVAKGLTADLGGQINLAKAVDLAAKFKDSPVVVADKPQAAEKINHIDVDSRDVATLKLSKSNFSSYDKAQDINAKVFDVKEDSVSLTGNTWKKLLVDYDVTKNTVLTFDFKSTVQGEVHGIGFDTDNKIGNNQLVQLYGTQDWAKHEQSYTGNGEWQSFRVDLGKLTTADIKYLTFAMDDDAKAKGNSFYDNIRLYEDNNGLVDATFTGTAGKDSFDFASLPGQGEYFEVKGFNKTIDQLDISELLIGYDAASDAIANFVQITTSGANSILKVNADGAGTDFVHVATIVGVTGLTDEAALVRNEQLLM